jgi:exodeoxyribonuclease V alpha subunit
MLPAKLAATFRRRNRSTQAALNPAGDRKVERFGWTFAPGDKVMQIDNDYDKEVYNGDIGYVDSSPTWVRSLRALTVGLSLTDWGTRHAGAGLCRDHPQKPGPGISCRDHPGHDAALRHVATEPSLSWRHTRLVVLVGQKKAVAIAARNISGRRRWSKLSDWLAPPSTKSLLLS